MDRRAFIKTTGIAAVAVALFPELGTAKHSPGASRYYWTGGTPGDETNWHNAANWVGPDGVGGADIPAKDDTAYLISSKWPCEMKAPIKCKALIIPKESNVSFNANNYEMHVGDEVTLNGGTVDMRKAILTIDNNDAFRNMRSRGTLTISTK